MIKSNFKYSGDPIFVIKVDHLVDSKVFAMVLTNHYYGDSLDFDPMIKKKEAMDVLKKGLRWAGDSGEYGGMDGVGDDHQDEWNAIYDAAKSWVIKNYPYLKS